MSSPKDLRRRLEALNRRGLSAAPQAPASPMPKEQEPHRPTPAIVYHRDLPRVEPRPSAPGSLLPMVLEEAEEGIEVAAEAGGVAFLIEKQVKALKDVPAGLSEAFGQALADAGSSGRKWAHRMCKLAEVGPEEVIFIDLETTGLSTTPLFLIGTLAWRQGDLILRQFFARDYSEELAVIRLFLQEASGKRLLVTFNGKTFDLPYVKTRAASHGIRFGQELHHLDLLHVCRRIWRKKLPDCRLQTLEQSICHRSRISDISGAAIPRAYHEFVRTKDAWEMVSCLEHNRLDLVTLADLLLRLPEPG